MCLRISLAVDQLPYVLFCFFFQAEDGIRDGHVTGVQTCALPICLAQASKLYRNLDELKHLTKFSKGGREIAWGTIGDASTSEGIFWETLNAAGVLQVPMVISVWDDEYGISVPKKYQTIKESISKALRGFKRTKRQPGFEILTVKAWDYVELLEAYRKAESVAREEHVPVLVHVEEVTQPQGHSTSGSHER